MSSNLTRITTIIMQQSYINIAKKYISQKRLDHSIRVCQKALHLANKYGSNVELITKAAILHDIAKHQTPETLSSINPSADLQLDCWENFPAVWHALVAHQFIEFELPGESKAIEHAVKFHTTGNTNMVQDAMIIFIADFIEPERSHPKRLEIETIANRSLEEAVAWITHFTIEKLNTKNLKIHPFTKNCWKYYCKYIPKSETWH